LCHLFLIFFLQSNPSASFHTESTMNELGMANKSFLVILLSSSWIFPLVGPERTIQVAVRDLYPSGSNN
jgi:hypothetical protein